MSRRWCLVPAWMATVDNPLGKADKVALGALLEAPAKRAKQAQAGKLVLVGKGAQAVRAARVRAARAVPIQAVRAVRAVQVQAAPVVRVRAQAAQICLCDTPAAGPNTYNETVTMIEGISIYGGYNCTDWSRDIATYVTVLKDDTAHSVAPGVMFPAGITAATALNGLTVAPNPIWNSNPLQSSVAISIQNSSPSLVDVIADGGSVPQSTGLVVSAQNGGIAAPTVTRGTYQAHGAFDLGATAVAVVLNGAAGTFTDVVIQPGGFPWYSYGLKCNGCSTTIAGGSISGGFANQDSRGVVVTGNAGGFSITGTSIHGGSGNMLASGSIGVEFSNCNGSPLVSAVDIFGGGGQNSIIGVSATGAQCAPIISGSTVDSPGGLAWYPTGIRCGDNAPCVVTNSTVTASGSGVAVVAVSCSAGGCANISGNAISVGTIDVATSSGIGLSVQGANPIVDGNRIAGPVCSSGMPTGPGPFPFPAAYFATSSSRITNNIFYDQPCSFQTGTLVLKNAMGAGAEVYNNTVRFTTCDGCSMKRGLVIEGSSGTDIVRNNIFVNAGGGGFADGYAVYESTSTSLQFFETNLLWAPNGGTLYLDNGTTHLALAGVNALSGAANNLSADPSLDATFHLLGTSPCRNAGTATGAPATDFEGNTRPQEMSYDIGADEYVP